MMSRPILAVVLGLGFGLTIPAAVSAQANSEALQALDEQLPGDLVNDPSRIDWESYGADMEAGHRLDETIPGGGAARTFTVKQASAQIYTAGANIPLTRKVDRGDTITVGFYARAVDAQTDDNNGVLRVRFQQNKEPYPGFGEETLSIGTDWDWYEVTATAERGLRPKDGIVAIQFGRTRQTLEIGQAIVVSGASAIASDAPVARTAIAAPPPAPTAELPPPLAGTGILLNDPGKDDWAFSGGRGSWEETKDKLWEAPLTQIVADGGPVALSAAIPVRPAMAEGDNIMVAIAARTDSASSEDGKGRIRVRIGDASGGETFSDNMLAVGENWQLLRVATKAPRAFEAGDLQVMLDFQGIEQELELGPVYVIKPN